MKKRGFQFHALPAEVADVVAGVMAGFGVKCIACRFFPFTVEVIDSNRLLAMLEDRSVGRLVLTLSEPITGVASPGALYEANPGSMHLEMGRVSAEGLRESLIGFGAEHDAPRPWVELLQRLKAKTQVGADAVSVDGSHRVHMPSHRYTAGASRLQDSGVPMLPLGGNAVRYEFRRKIHKKKRDH